MVIALLILILVSLLVIQYQLYTALYTIVRNQKLGFEEIIKYLKNLENREE